MNNIRHITLCAALSITMLTGCMVSAVTVKADETNDATWHLSEDGSTLQITGDGWIPDYNEGEAPWADYADLITDVYVGSGITSIGKYAFAGLENMEAIHLPDTLETVGANAFKDCTALEATGDDPDADQDYDPNVKTGAFLFNVDFRYSTEGNEAFANARRVDSFPVNSSTAYNTYGSKSGSTNLFGAGVKTDMCAQAIELGMIPQGITYYPAKDWFLVSAYDSNEKYGSAIFAMDASTGKCVAQFNIADSGYYYVGHMGGIAVTEHGLYFTFYKNKIGCINLEELDVPEGTVKELSVGSKIEVAALAQADSDDPAYLAYMSYSDDALWMGNFYSLSGGLLIDDSWDNKATDNANSLLLGYDLSDRDSYEEEVKNMKSLAEASMADYYIALPNGIDCVQGATVADGKLILSCTEGASFDAALWYTDITLKDGLYTSLKKSAFECESNLRGAENIVVVDGTLYCIYESAALYLNEDNIAWSLSPVYTDAIWKVNMKYF